MELKTKIKEIEDQTTISRQRMRKLESEAAGSRHDVALLAAFQHEIKTIKREISTAEELGLQLVELADQQKSESDKLKAEIEAAESVHAEFSRNVERECTVAQQKLDQLSAQRAERLQATIPPESLTLYERLLGARQGQAMAELDGRICQACYMEVPTNLFVRVARGTALTQCPSCDRILFQRL
jgi:predicted  nucleic acid-binding Zn-ribbon protein